MMLLTAFNNYSGIDGDTPETMHPEPLLYMIVDWPIQFLVTNDKDIIKVQNYCSNHYSVIVVVMEHAQYSIDA